MHLLRYIACSTTALHLNSKICDLSKIDFSLKEKTPRKKICYKKVIRLSKICKKILFFLISCMYNLQTKVDKKNGANKIITQV